MKEIYDFDVVSESYATFLKQKELIDSPSGFNVELQDMNPMLFDWQKVIVKWALRRGRAALFEDCGLGKTPQQLEWARMVSDREDAPVIIFAPLAVSEQTRQEGEKFGIPVRVCRDKADVGNGINVTNYEKFHKFDPSEFCGIVIDESSILKSFTGVFRNEVIDAFGTIPYKLACTATPAPNDYMELGNHAEFLGVMTRSEMLSTFFINDSGDTGKWRLKGHVKKNLFWQWLSSWSVMLSKPSELGYDDDGFILPQLHYHEMLLETPPGARRKGRGLLPIFDVVQGMDERREVRRDTTEVRCTKAAELINATDSTWVVWCNLNAEGDLLERLIEGAVQVAGRHSDEYKADTMLAFANGKIRRIISKPKIAGHGMNWQVCSNVVFVGLNDSWEDLYQAVRRVWRFGQREEVHVHIILDEREGSVLANVKEKDKRARAMISEMISHTKELSKRNIVSLKKEFVSYQPTIEMELPKWMSEDYKH